MPDQSGGYYLQYSSRNSKSDGPKQYLDISCLDEEVSYNFSAKIKLSNVDGTPFSCENSEKSRTDTFCADVTFELILSSEKKRIRFVNEDSGSWSENGFNDFRFSFKVTEEMKAAQAVYFTIAGSNEDTMILFDDVIIARVTEKENDISCGHIVNSVAKLGDSTGWNVFQRGGTVTKYFGGVNGSDSPLQQTGRTKSVNGAVQIIDFSCFAANQVLNFSFQFKLEEEDGSLLPCKKNKGNTTSRCVDVAIRITRSGSNSWTRLVNDGDDPVDGPELTTYHSKFVVTMEMISAESVMVLLYGPKAGATIIFDDVRFN